MSGFEVHVSDDFMIDGVAIYVSLKHDHGRQILRLGEDGSQAWEDHEPLTTTAPTLKLPGEAARANRKQRIQAAAMRVHDERAVTLSKAPGSGTDTMTHDSAQKRSQRRHGNAGTAT